MQTYTFKKDGCKPQYFKETLSGVQIGNDPNTLKDVSFKFAKMKWESLLGNGWELERE